MGGCRCSSNNHHIPFVFQWDSYIAHFPAKGKRYRFAEEKLKFNFRNRQPVVVVKTTTGCPFCFYRKVSVVHKQRNF